MATGCALVGSARRTTVPRTTDGTGLAVAPLADGREERNSSRCVQTAAPAASCGRAGLAHRTQLLKGGLAIRALVLIDRHRLVPRLSGRRRESPMLSGKEWPRNPEMLSLLPSFLEAPLYTGWLRLVGRRYALGRQFAPGSFMVGSFSWTAGALRRMASNRSGFGPKTGLLYNAFGFRSSESRLWSTANAFGFCQGSDCADTGQSCPSAGRV
jgi:hypothetical protein